MKKWNYKNKEEVALLISDILNSNSASYLHFICLEHLIWAATERSNNGVKRKYFGQPLWSKNAIQRVFDNIENNIDPIKGLTHEHTVPRKIIINLIKALESPTKENILSILDNYAFAAIITNEEDLLINDNKLRDSMPEEEIGSFLDRYKNTFEGNNNFSLYNLSEIIIKNLRDFQKQKTAIFDKIKREDIFSL
jgi:hypothetical protein